MKTTETAKVEYPVIYFATPREWEDWLEENGEASQGVWLQFYKKGASTVSVIYEEALQVALCYGWIDGQSKKYDDDSYLQKFTPRRPKGTWSKKNIERIERLMEEGRMKPSGLKEVENAKADGRWDGAYDSPANMEMPQDFLDELSKDSKAFAFFETLNRTNRFTIGWRLQTAKTSATRQKRMKAIIDMLSREEKFNP